ncbi:MAG: LuxR C-terminal-related transcriptional regulator [Ruminococcus sp.]|jgi:LuxR family maltose regulon positive regulatory protein|nr:LuxR C-terminal-related transcriptional regulator [Ruminococcus sp.]
MTDTTFLSDKFTLASLPENVMPRTALIPVYDKAAESRFIYVCAPAGSGKTVSALLWIESKARDTIWIGLDKYDSVPSVFFKQLSLGLFSKQPQNEGMLSILNNPGFSASPVEQTIALINEMHPDDTPFVLVLDDLHLIKNNEIFKAIPFIIKRLPANFTVVFISRFAPPAEFLPLVTHKNLIGSEYLRFSEDEISSYFKILGQDLTDKQRRMVFDMTEGWVMGVNAVAHSGIKNSEDLNSFDFSGYFESQIWGLWTPDLRKFCLDTAVLDEFSSDLAKIMTDRNDSADVLEVLSRTNSFISCIHDDLYRYHHIFQDFLRRKLRDNKNSSELYKKAAEYYKAQGDYTRALRYMIHSGDWKSIDAYLLLFLFKNRRGGVADYADFLRGFFNDDFPEKAYREMPVLHVLAAWFYYLTGRYEKFALHMDSIIKKLPAIAKAGNEFVEFSIMAFSVDYRKTMKQKEQIYGFFRILLKGYTPEGLATSIASYTHGLPFVTRSNVDYNEFALDPNWMKGLQKTFAPLLGAEWEYLQPLFSATFAYERGQFTDALALITESESLIKPIHKIDGRICVAFLKHAVLLHLGKGYASQEKTALSSFTELVENEGQDFLPNLKAYKTKMKLLLGDEEAAAAWLDEYFVVEIERIELFRLYQHFTTARVFILTGRFDEAERLLRLLSDYGENLNRPIDKAEALLLLAVLYSARRDKKGAESFLFAALEILVEYEYSTLIADEGTAIEPILKRVQTKVSSPDYKGKLTRIYVNEVLMAAHAQARSYPNYLRPKSDKKSSDIKLSRRQKDVIMLLSKGNHTAEICALTGLSLSTVKTHLYFAYKKLGVNDALDAVLRARELGII